MGKKIKTRKGRRLVADNPTRTDKFRIYIITRLNIIYLKRNKTRKKYVERK
jgi:hypothetical protein